VERSGTNFIQYPLEVWGEVLNKISSLKLFRKRTPNTNERVVPLSAQMQLRFATLHNKYEMKSGNREASFKRKQVIVLKKYYF